MSSSAVPAIRGRPSDAFFDEFFFEAAFFDELPRIPFVMPGTQDLADAIAEAMTREQGKTIEEARGEIMRSAMTIRWFADDRLIHVRRAGEPTPIPHLPMVFHMNTWATCSEALAGPIDEAALPTTATFQSVAIHRWDPAPRSGLDALFHDPVDPDGWMTGD